MNQYPGQNYTKEVKEEEYIDELGRTKKRVIVRYRLAQTNINPTPNTYKEVESIIQPQNDSMVMMTQINATPIKPTQDTNFLNESSFFHSTYKTFS
jgi:hypothetical protein